MASTLVLLMSTAVIGAPAWYDPSPAAVALQTAITHAIQTGQSVVSVPNSDIVFNSAPLNITNASHLTIVGGDATCLTFRPGVGINIIHSRNTTLRSLVVDYNPLPYVVGYVQASNSGEDTAQILVRIPNISMTYEDLVNDFPPHDIWPPVTAYKTGTLDFRKSLGSWGKPPAFTKVDDTHYQLAYNSDGLEAGDAVVAPTRIGFTLVSQYSSGLVFEDMVLHGAGNMAMTEFQGLGGNIYRNVSLVPRGPETPLASNADGFHSSGMSFGPTLSNVVMTNLLDDYFNVHNTFQLVVKRTGPYSMLVGDYQLFNGDNTMYGTQETLCNVEKRSMISFYELNTFTYPPVATSTVEEIVRVTDPSLQALLSSAHTAAASKAVKTPCSACTTGLHPYSKAQLYNVTFASAVPESVTALHLFNAESISNTGAIVEDCSFTGSGSNLGRFKSSNGRIVRTTWNRGPTNQNLEIEALQSWLEGMLGIHNVTIEDNVFFGTSTSPINTFSATNVIQKNNSFIE